MPLNLDDVNLFSGMEIREGDVLLYSSDFNGGYNKADVEIESLRRISDSGGITAIIAHKGRYGKDTPDLNDFADYIGGIVDRNVKYYPENSTLAAVKRIGELDAGDTIIMGNTRMHEGEEKNDSALARQFADLALKNGENSRLVIGGPGKAHRKNASNYAIQDFMPACVAPSIISEMRAIEPWAGKGCRHSVAVLGGVKGEKIKDGLVGFAKNYDAVIPGGIVLNTILKVQGRKIGKSVVSDEGKTFEKYAKEVLKSENAYKICIPKLVRVARKTEGGFDGEKWIRIDKESVPDDYMIVDFALPDSALGALNMAGFNGGRLVVAGTPGIAKEGFKVASDVIIGYANMCGPNALVMGGDTGNELKVRDSVKTVTIGGAGLYYAANGTTPVWKKLRENKERFGKFN